MFCIGDATGQHRRGGQIVFHHAEPAACDARGLAGAGVNVGSMAHRFTLRMSRALAHKAANMTPPKIKNTTIISSLSLYFLI